MNTIFTVVGARPQFIKAAVVSRALRAHRSLRECFVHTGQHYDENMSGIFFQELGMSPPDVQLAVGSGGHGAQTGRMLEALEREMLARKPRCVLIYGDTNSTLAAALAAVKLHIPVAHVEAGLRSFNMRMPEEVNRIVADRVSDLLFTPTDDADRNLANEGVPSWRVHRVGDVMLDAVQHELSQPQDSILDSLGLAAGGYVLATIHRAENTDVTERLKVIAEALERIAEEVPVVLPLHPRTAHAMTASGITLNRVRLLDPVGYRAMIALEAGASIVVTDSGGVQKEAFFSRRPCVTLRDQTEWTELVDAGWNRLAPPTDVQSIVDATRYMLSNVPATAPAFYGDGTAGERIVRVLTEHFGV